MRRLITVDRWMEDMGYLRWNLRCLRRQGWNIGIGRDWDVRIGRGGMVWRTHIKIIIVIVIFIIIN